MASLNSLKITNIFQLLKENLFDYTTFIETGTLVGDTVVGLSPLFENLHTIEISEHYHQLSTQRIKDQGLGNIRTYLGDSSKVLSDVLKPIKKNNKCVFWLDGHWSAGDTGRGEKDCPLVEECNTINQLYVPDKAIVLIDDYRLFGTALEQDWGQISAQTIESCFTNFIVSNQMIYDDVLSFVITRK